MPKTPRLNLAARTFKIELGTFLRACEGISSPRALACYILAVNNEWEQYLELPALDYSSPSFADDYLVSEMLRKNPNLPIKNNRRKNAVAKWWEAENACASTNELLRNFISGDVNPLKKSTLGIIDRARDIITAILGPLTKDKLSFCESKMRFGPGSTSSVTGRDVIESKKYMCSMHISPRLYPYWNSLRTASKDVELRAYSKVTFVPKTATIDRAIAIEPHMNVYVQLGIGALLRRQLTRFGLNLDRQADVNRAMAKRAHEDGLATVDLSSASDTIASELVWLLLPYEWACLLDLPRVEYSMLDGKEVRLDKFSSMGNGFTFELESLIFLAIARATGDSEAVTFGDDIILKREFYPLLKDALDFLGFTVNTKKTFLAGRFFESCGHDYCDGTMVRPFYLKGDYHDFPSACIRILNKIRRYSHMRNNHIGCDIRFLPAWRHVHRACPIASRTYISEGFGDDGICKNFDEATPSIAKHGHEGYVCRVLRVECASYDVHTSIGALTAALHRGALRSKKSVSGSRQFVRTTLGYQVVPYWYDLGPWVISPGTAVLSSNSSL